MPALQYFLDKGGQFWSAFGAVLHKLCFILLHQLLCLGGKHGFSLLLKVSGRLKFDNPKDRLPFSDNLRQQIFNKRRSAQTATKRSNIPKMLGLNPTYALCSRRRAGMCCLRVLCSKIA